MNELTKYGDSAKYAFLEKVFLGRLNGGYEDVTVSNPSPQNLGLENYIIKSDDGFIIMGFVHQDREKFRYSESCNFERFDGLKLLQPDQSAEHGCEIGEDNYKVKVD